MNTVKDVVSYDIGLVWGSIWSIMLRNFLNLLKWYLILLSLHSVSKNWFRQNSVFQNKMYIMLFLIPTIKGKGFLDFNSLVVFTEKENNIHIFTQMYMQTYPLQNYFSPLDFCNYWDTLIFEFNSQFRS